MPKLKTNSGAAKRFKITGSGKVKRNKSGMRHLLTSKAKKTKRVLRKSGLIYQEVAALRLRVDISFYL